MYLLVWHLTPAFKMKNSNKNVISALFVVSLYFKLRYFVYIYSIIVIFYSSLSFSDHIRFCMYHWTDFVHIQVVTSTW